MFSLFCDAPPPTQGKNVSLKEMFESGQFESEEKREKMSKEEIKIDEKRAAKSLRAKFEKGQPFIMDEEGETTNGHGGHGGEIQEVEEVFKDAGNIADIYT